MAHKLISMNTQIKKFLHEASDDDVNTLLTNNATVGDLKKIYKEPEWCGDVGALDGKWGCWSLMDLKVTRKKICREFCKSCDSYVEYL